MINVVLVSENTSRELNEMLFRSEEFGGRHTNEPYETIVIADAEGDDEQMFFCPLYAQNYEPSLRETLSMFCLGSFTAEGTELVKRLRMGPLTSYDIKRVMTDKVQIIWAEPGEIDYESVHD